MTYTYAAIPDSAGARDSGAGRHGPAGRTRTPARLRRAALDRAVRLAECLGASQDTAAWARARDEIRRAIVAEGYDEEVSAFTQSFGGRALDASALVIPLTGFLPATDPRVLSTVQRIRECPTSRGLVYRYLAEDGLTGGEATFAMCSFWLVDNFALQGRVDEARELFERVAGYASERHGAVRGRDRAGDRRAARPPPRRASRPGRSRASFIRRSPTTSGARP
jgi:hypothetical protein